MSGTVATARPSASAQVGMIAFLGSWTMLFVALLYGFAALRLDDAAAFELGAVSLLWPALATVAIAVSSAAVWRGWFGVAALCGVAFVAVQSLAWIDVYSLGHGIDTAGFGAAFFAVTGAHLLHVVVGIAALVLLSLRPRGPAHALWSQYWHFVGVVWLFVAIEVYVW